MPKNKIIILLYAYMYGIESGKGGGSVSEQARR